MLQIACVLLIWLACCLPVRSQDGPSGGEEPGRNSLSHAEEGVISGTRVEPPVLEVPEIPSTVSERAGGQGYPLAVGTMRGQARFRASPILVPDAVQERLAARLLVTTRGTDLVRADFGGTQGIQLSRDETKIAGIGAHDPGYPGVPQGSAAFDAPTTFTAVFDEPAHFAFAAGSGCPAGTLANNRPVLIYEGMTVTWHADGRYEVRFITEAPDVSVLIRMQLQVLFDDQPLGSITLPPVSLTQPDAEVRSGLTSRAAGETRTWVVRRTGYSHLLHAIDGPDRQRVSVVRGAAIRIGQPPESGERQ